MRIPTELIVALRAAKKIAVLTGAGISAESGVPTFREAQTGLWQRFRPEELATPEAFQRDPALVWKWYTWRRELIGRAEPNPGHYALARIEALVPDFTLITQNVDDLHRRAGSQSVIELHGNIQTTKCSLEGTVVDVLQTGSVPTEQQMQTGLPRCPQCGSLLRPDVVWFGENLPALALEQAWEKTRICDLFFSIGTSGLVQPAASLPWLAFEQGTPVVEINPEQTPLSRAATYTLQGPAGVILPELVRQTWEKPRRSS